MDASKLALIQTLFPMIAVIVSVAVGGWVVTTWLRIKHGYPLDGAWGQAIYPKKNEEAMERIKLLSTENAQLRAELGSVKDRLALGVIEDLQRVASVLRVQASFAPPLRGRGEGQRGGVLAGATEATGP